MCAVRYRDISLSVDTKTREGGTFLASHSIRSLASESSASFLLIFCLLLSTQTLCSLYPLLYVLSIDGGDSTRIFIYPNTQEVS